MSDLAAIDKLFSDMMLSTYEQKYRELKHRRQKLVISRRLPLATFLLLLRDGIAVQIRDDSGAPMVTLEPMAA